MQYKDENKQKGDRKRLPLKRSDKTKVALGSIPAIARYLKSKAQKNIKNMTPGVLEP